MDISYDHLQNNSTVVSEKTRPPYRMITLKSAPNPNTTAECPYSGVILAGRVTCRMIEKTFLMCNSTAA